MGFPQEFGKARSTNSTERPQNI